MNSEENVRILALAGSYRKGSFNQALLTAIKELAPAGVEVVDFDLRTVPFFDQDLEEAGAPQSVDDLKAAVVDADAVLFVTPEYNHGVPAVLKNGLDWSSRIYPNAPLGGKIAAVIGATPGRDGTSFAQANLRESLSTAGSTLVEAELLLARAGDAITDGVVSSDELKGQLSAVVDAITAAVAAQASESESDAS